MEVGQTAEAETPINRQKETVSVRSHHGVTGRQQQGDKGSLWWR